MNVRIIREAETELADATAHYESIESGLGVRLKEEARTTLRWVSQNPDLPRIHPSGYHRVNFKVFPYYVAYVKWNDAILDSRCGTCSAPPQILDPSPAGARFRRD